MVKAFFYNYVFVFGLMLVIISLSPNEYIVYLKTIDYTIRIFFIFFITGIITYMERK